MREDHWKRLYTDHAADYERLVQCEDYQAHLLAALDRICPLENTSVVEFGAGTGRITAQLIPLVERIWTFDLNPSMVRVAREKGLAGPHCLVGIGDSRATPVAGGVVDVAVEGWSLVQIAVWHPARWRQEVDRVVGEMGRVVRPGGMVIVIETLGTGVTTPRPPKRCQDVYTVLEQEKGFGFDWCRTDFRFPNHEMARQLVGLIFGQEMLASLDEVEGKTILPECTGLWWQRV